MKFESQSVIALHGEIRMNLDLIFVALFQFVPPSFLCSSQSFTNEDIISRKNLPRHGSTVLPSDYQTNGQTYLPSDQRFYHQTL